MLRSANRKITALAAGRPDVTHPEVGELDFSTPKHSIDAAFEAARADWTKYTSNTCLPACDGCYGDLGSVVGIALAPGELCARNLTLPIGPSAEPFQNLVAGHHIPELLNDVLQRSAMLVVR
jgi:hypothetical protein